MIPLPAALAVALTMAGGAVAEDELHPACENVGEITVTAFGARVDGVSPEEALRRAGAGADPEADGIISGVVEAAYALDIAGDEAEAEEQIVNFTAEMILACEEAIRAS